jgi:hypothetical protein
VYTTLCPPSIVATPLHPTWPRSAVEDPVCETPISSNDQHSSVFAPAYEQPYLPLRQQQLRVHIAPRDCQVQSSVVLMTFTGGGVGTFVGLVTLALTGKKGSAKSHLDLLDMDVTSYANQYMTSMPRCCFVQASQWIWIIMAHTRTNRYVLLMYCRWRWRALPVYRTRITQAIVLLLSPHQLHRYSRVLTGR